MKFLLLVSGGPDSVYLFRRFREKRDVGGADFAVLHVNHGLRGDESDGDETFVRDLCASHGVTCFVRRLDSTTFDHGNVQAVARRERLMVCFELQRDEGFDAAVTAHHADDAVETLVMRAARGAGVAGLCGLRERSRLRNPLLPKKRLFLLRPLLGLTKADILDRLAGEAAAFRTDSSNFTEKYFRNRVRKGLAGVDGTSRRIPLTLSRALQPADDYYRARVAFLARRYRHFVPATAWDAWPEEMRFRFFTRKMRGNGFRKQVERGHFAATSRPQSKLVLGGAHFFKDASGCYFYSGRALDRMKSEHRVQGPGAYLFGPWEKSIVIRGEDVGSGGFPLSVFTAGEYGSVPLKATAVQTPRGKVNLKDWFYEAGVQRYARILWPVVSDRNGWVINSFPR